jgi:hypothetical protein
MPTYLDVDPATLHLPPARWQGADPGKLTRQISRHGTSVVGMPAPLVHRDGNGRLKLMDGVTRATRVAKLLPGTLVRVEVIEEKQNADYSTYPTVGDRLP